MEAKKKKKQKRKLMENSVNCDSSKSPHFGQGYLKLREMYIEKCYDPVPMGRGEPQQVDYIYTFKFYPCFCSGGYSPHVL